MVRRSEKPVSAERSGRAIKLKSLEPALLQATFDDRLLEQKNEGIEKTSWCPPSCFETTSHEDATPKNAGEMEWDMRGLRSTGCFLPSTPLTSAWLSLRRP